MVVFVNVVVFLFCGCFFFMNVFLLMWLCFVFVNVFLLMLLCFFFLSLWFAVQGQCKIQHGADRKSGTKTTT